MTEGLITIIDTLMFLAGDSNSDPEAESDEDNDSTKLKRKTSSSYATVYPSNNLLPPDYLTNRISDTNIETEPKKGIVTHAKSYRNAFKYSADL